MGRAVVDDLRGDRQRRRKCRIAGRSRSPTDDETLPEVKLPPAILLAKAPTLGVTRMPPLVIVLVPVGSVTVYPLLPPLALNRRLLMMKGVGGRVVGRDRDVVGGVGEGCRDP